MLGALNDWLYDRDPLGGLRFEKPLAELKAALDAGEPVFQQLIGACWLRPASPPAAAPALPAGRAARRTAPG